MVLPKVNKTYFQEREGVLKVGLIINSLGLIFRETSNADVGVDGMAEYVSDEGNATGKIIGLQIKSGESYFNEKDDYFKFYFDKKHREYWETFPIPLILLLHNPITNQIYYVDVRHYFRNPKNLDKKYIEVDKLNILKSKSDIFYTSGVKNTKSREDFLGLGINNLIRALNEKKLEFKDEIDSIEVIMDYDELFKYMMKMQTNNPEFNLSFFDLFVGGITNLGRSLFFDFGLAYNLVELLNNTDYISCFESDHNFLYKYVRFLINQNIANIDFSDFLIDFDERSIQPILFVPLTERSRLYLEYLYKKIKEILNQENTCIISESFIYLDIKGNYSKFSEMKKLKLLYKQEN